MLQQQNPDVQHTAQLYELFLLESIQIALREAVETGEIILFEAAHF